jgi:hypothetical protein
LWCWRRYYKNRCKLMFLALKTIKGGYHVYKHGEHNHPIRKSKRHLYCRKILLFNLHF